MAQITVTGDDGRLVHREWVLPLQADSDHFLGCLAERLRWAIRDSDRGREGEVLLSTSHAVTADGLAGEPVALTADADTDTDGASVEEHVSLEPVLVG